VVAAVPRAVPDREVDAGECLDQSRLIKTLHHDLGVDHILGDQPRHRRRADVIDRYRLVTQRSGKILPKTRELLMPPR